MAGKFYMVTTSEAGKQIAKSSMTAFHKAINKRPTRLKLKNVTEVSYTFLFNGSDQDILKEYVELEQAFVEIPTILESNMLINTIWEMEDGTEETVQYRYVKTKDGEFVLPLYKRLPLNDADKVPEDEDLKDEDFLPYPVKGDVPNDDWYWPVYEELHVGDIVQVYFSHDYRGEVRPEFRAKGWEKVRIMESVGDDDNSHAFIAEYTKPKREIEDGDDADTIDDKKTDNQVKVDVWYRPVRRLQEDSDSGEDSDESVDSDEMVSDSEDDESHTEGDEIQYKGNTYVLSFEEDDKGDRIYKLTEKEGAGVELLTSEQLDNRFIPELSIGERILHNDTVKEIVGINYTHKKYVVREIDDSDFVLLYSSDDASDYLLCDDEMVSAQDIKELSTVISLFTPGDKVLYNWHICQIAIVENDKYTLIDQTTGQELTDVSESDITGDNFVLKKDDLTVWKIIETKDKKNKKGKKVPHVYLQNEENSKKKRGKKKSIVVSTYENNYIAHQREIGDFLKGKDRRDGSKSGHDSDLADLVYQKGDKVLYAPEGVKEVKATVKYVEEDTIQIQIDGASETITVRDDELRLDTGEEEEDVLEVGDYVFEKGTLWQVATVEGKYIDWTKIEEAVHWSILAYKGDDRKHRVEYIFDDDSGKWVERNPEDDSEDEDSEGDAPVEAEYREGEYVEIDGNISKIEKVNGTKYKLEGLEDWVDEYRILYRYKPNFAQGETVFTVSACDLRKIKGVIGDGTYALDRDEIVKEKDLRRAIEVVKPNSLVQVSGEKHQYFIVQGVDGCNYRLKNIYSNEESLVDIENVDEFEAPGFAKDEVVKYKVGDVEKYGEVTDFDKTSCLYKVKDCNGSPHSHIREDDLEAAEPMLDESVKVHVKYHPVFSITGVDKKNRTYTLKSEDVPESEVSEVDFGDGEEGEEEASKDPLLGKGTFVTLRLENPTFEIKAKNELKRTYKVGGVFSANVVDKVK